MNAKQEFIEHTKDKTVLCAIISFKYDEEYDDTPKQYLLKSNYSPEDYKKFLVNINKTYDAGYGGQELFGTIWYTDGTWSERGEYDGSEWWSHKLCPQIPDDLK